MILDLENFARRHQPLWEEFEGLLTTLEGGEDRKMSVDEIQRFHYLYEKISADLAQVSTFAAEPELRRYLESLVARAYAEIHETRSGRLRFRPWQWVTRTFPQTFRRHAGAFWLATALMLVGAFFGARILQVNPEARQAVMPFDHLLVHPSERVAMEERQSAEGTHMEGVKATFSSQLMTHNTRVSLLTLALGLSYGIGTGLVLFYNGVILGAVSFDFIAAGESQFLAGWLLPHGAVEIPAFVIAGQAGFVLAFALLGWKSREPLAVRIRKMTPDLVTLIAGVALLLVWAGIIESYLSQYHEPAIPYSAKIVFGVTELVLLTLYLTLCGRTEDSTEPAAPRPS